MTSCGAWWTRSRRSRGRILGVVLNRADPRRDGYYYYYQAYQSYYGADEGGTKR